MFPQAYRPLMLDEDVNILLRKMNLNDCLYTTEIPISFENYKKIRFLLTHFLGVIINNNLNIQTYTTTR